MASSAAETVIGAVVIAAAVVFAVYANRMGGGRIVGDTYPLVANFRSAEGIAIGTDVRLAGIRVGAVTGLALDPDSYTARTTLALRDDLRLPDDSDIKIASEGLLGGAYVELTPGASDFMLAAGDEIVNTQGSVSLLNLLMRFGAGQ